MATLTITAEFEPDEDDDLAGAYGPVGILEALTAIGLYDIDVEVEA